MSIVPEEESLRSLSDTSEFRDPRRPRPQKLFAQERSGTLPTTRSRTSETLSAIQMFGTIPTPKISPTHPPPPQLRSSASQISFGNRNSTYSVYGSTGDIVSKSGQGRSGKNFSTTFQQRPLPRSQSYTGTNLYKKQEIYSGQQLQDLKWSIPPPPPEFQSGSSNLSESRSTQVNFYYKYFKICFRFL